MIYIVHIQANQSTKQKKKRRLICIWEISQDYDKNIKNSLKKKGIKEKLSINVLCIWRINQSRSMQDEEQSCQCQERQGDKIVEKGWDEKVFWWAHNPKNQQIQIS